MTAYLIYKMGEFLAIHLPLRLAYKIAIIISDLHSLFTPKDRINIYANLKKIFPNKSDYEIVKIRRQIFINFAKYLVDFFRFPLLNKQNINKIADVVNLKFVDEALSFGKGAILVTAHLSNWELGGVMLALMGYPIGAVVLPHLDKRVDNFFNSRRQMKGMVVMPLGKAARDCLNLLHSNKLIALVGDRSFNSTELLVDFFGLPTYFPKGPAVFAFKTKAPVVPCFVLRNPDDRYRFIFEKPIWPHPKKTAENDLVGFISEYRRVIEEYIKRYPEQWFMFRKFWAGAQ